MLEIRHLHFKHPGAAPEILRGVSFGVKTGQMTALLGPNGSGKTTLFKCVAGLWLHQAGDISFDGQDISSLSPEKRAWVLAVVPQEHEPPFPYSVFDAVLMGRASHVPLFNSPGRRDREVVQQALEAVGIGHLHQRPYTKISGGERQLVLVARALAQEAPLLLLDEPTSHLDFRNQIVILRKVRDTMRKQGLTVLMTLHDPNLAMQFADEVVMLHEGREIAAGAPAEVLTAENLRRMYGIDVNLINYNGYKVIYPRVEHD
ncbi:MAG: ABC transporter ATP-binding protein [Deltaproteobacteria bacterium]|nr:ABC transporter ATP-binding protein [Deltaproteobacteria bacterium]